MRQYWIYILTNRSGTLYIGMTNDLERRIEQHKRKLIAGFTARYNITRLIYFESFPDPWQAIEAEKKLKGWTRAKKIALIKTQNPDWRDLSDDWKLSSSTIRRNSDPCQKNPPFPASLVRAAKNLKPSSAEILHFVQDDNKSEHVIAGSEESAIDNAQNLRSAQDDIAWRTLQ